MKIGIQTWGSNGDIRPIIALADGLQNAGHTVLAPAHIPAKYVTPAKLAERIKATIESDDMAQRAQQAKHMVSPIQGVLNAVALIGSLNLAGL